MVKGIKVFFKGIGLKKVLVDSYRIVVSISNSTNINADQKDVLVNHLVNI